MERTMRHDRSQLLYPELPTPGRPSRQALYLNILSLRAARAAYHLLAGNGEFADITGAQLRWELRAFAAELGLRLVISGASHDLQGRRVLN